MALAKLESPSELLHEQALDHFTKPPRFDDLEAAVETSLRTLEAHQEEDDNDGRN